MSTLGLVESVALASALFAGLVSVLTATAYPRLRPLLGRTVIVPLLQGDRVAAFGRIQVRAVDSRVGSILLTLSRSALSNLARSGSIEFQRRALASDPAPRGLVLISRLDPTEAGA